MSENWVEDRLAALTADAEWRPSVTRARKRIEERRTNRSRRIGTWTWASAAGVLTAAILFAFPTPRAFAQRLWESRVLGRVEAARVDLDALPIRWSLTGGYSAKVRDAEEAGQKAGFRPNFPAPGLLSGPATLSVVEPTSAQIVINADELKASLERAGASDVAVPKEWDGPSFGFQIGPVIEADYGSVVIKQCRPIVLLTPPGFSLVSFAEAAFRIGGLGSDAARDMAVKFEANPSWLIGIPPGAPETIQEVSLQSGPGLFIEGPGRASLIWNAPDRIYEVSGKISHSLAETVANSLQ